jgi:rod shape-determining protein MreD
MMVNTAWNQLSQLVDRSPVARLGVSCVGTALSVFLCLMLSPTRLPGMELAGIAPNWLLIWVVAWSLKRAPWQAVAAGFTLGLLQDAMTQPLPTHAFSLMAVGLLTARIQKQRFLQEDFISVALIVFGMAVIAETIMALQFSIMGTRSLVEIWKYHQLIALSSAILSSLWAPVLYFPLNRWWDWIGVKREG